MNVTNSQPTKELSACPAAIGFAGAVVFILLSMGFTAPVWSLLLEEHCEALASAQATEWDWTWYHGCAHIARHAEFVCLSAAITNALAFALFMLNANRQKEVALGMNLNPLSTMTEFINDAFGMLASFSFGSVGGMCALIGFRNRYSNDYYALRRTVVGGAFLAQVVVIWFGMGFIGPMVEFYRGRAAESDDVENVAVKSERMGGPEDTAYMAMTIVRDGNVSTRRGIQFKP